MSTSTLSLMLRPLDILHLLVNIIVDILLNLSRFVFFKGPSDLLPLSLRWAVQICITLCRRGAWKMPMMPQ